MRNCKLQSIHSHPGFFETLGSRSTRTHRTTVTARDKQLKERTSLMYHTSRKGVRYIQEELRGRLRFSSGQIPKAKHVAASYKRWHTRAKKWVRKVRDGYLRWKHEVYLNHGVRPKGVFIDYLLARLWVKQNLGNKKVFFMPTSKVSNPFSWEGWGIARSVITPNVISVEEAVVSAKQRGGEFLNYVMHYAALYETPLK